MEVEVQAKPEVKVEVELEVELDSEVGVEVRLRMTLRLRIADKLCWPGGGLNEIGLMPSLPPSPGQESELG